MDIEELFRFKRGDLVCHKLDNSTPLLVVERMYYERPGGVSILYYLRDSYKDDRLHGIHEEELSEYKKSDIKLINKEK